MSLSCLCLFFSILFFCFVYPILCTFSLSPFTLSQYALPSTFPYLILLHFLSLSSCKIIFYSHQSINLVRLPCFNAMPCHKNLDLYKLTWEEFLKNKQQEIINSFKANQMLNFGSKSEIRKKNKKHTGKQKRNKKKKW